LNILVPCRVGESLSEDGRESIRVQTDECHIIEYAAQPQTERRAHEAKNRNYLRRFACGRYCAMIDSDVILLDAKDIETVVAEIDSNKEIDAIAIDSKDLGNLSIRNGFRRRGGIGPHVVISCVVFRTEALKTLTFRQFKPNACLCCAVNMDIHIKYSETVRAREVKRCRS